MIKLTKRAADQVRASAEQGDMQDMALRIAARRNDDGTFEYGIGFDAVQDSDEKLDCEGLVVVVAQESKPLLEGAVVDFVEIEPGQPHFIFMNPKDPNYVPPSDLDLADVPPKAGEH
jgi:iron-sulfur cluster assembly protein